MDEFRLERQKAAAIGYPTTPGGRPRFLVRAGSTAMRNGSPNVKRKAGLTADLAARGVLRPHSTDPNLWIFAQDHEFDSASAAGDVINDGNLSAPQHWQHVRTGESLKEWLIRKR